MVVAVKSDDSAPHLPNALVVGPMKAGSTWVHDYLSYRGDVALPAPDKESFFFDRYYDRGPEWYAEQFSRREVMPASSVVEIGPSYFHHPDVPARVRETLGSIPLVFTLRNPVKRAWSHYLHIRRYGLTTKSLQSAVADYPAILDASRYRECVKRWREALPDSPTTFVWQETLAQDPAMYARRVSEGLDIPHVDVPWSMIGQSNAAAVPASTLLARLAYRGARFCRDHGLGRAVHWARAIGFQPLVFGRPGSARHLEPSDAECSWLASQLREQGDGEPDGHGYL